MEQHWRTLVRGAPSYMNDKCKYNFDRVNSITGGETFIFFNSEKMRTKRNISLKDIKWSSIEL